MVRMLKFLVGLIVIAVVTIVLAETALRVLFDKYDPDQDLIFITQAGGFRLGDAGTESRHWKNTGDFDVPVLINDAGFRDARKLTDSSPGDWFVVGDSYGFGFGVPVETRFSNRLEKITGIPFYNISIPNDLDGYLALVQHARRNGAEIQRLIISVCMENDVYLYDDAPVPAEVEVRVPESAVLWNVHYVKHYLADNSALYKATTEIVHHLPLLRTWAVELGFIRENLDGIPANEFSYPVVESSADRAEDLASIPGLEQVLFVIVPSRGLWVDGFREEHERIHIGFVETLRKRGFEVVDLRSDFEANGDPLSYHFENDGHWNEAGHALAAQVIAGRLAEL